MPSSVRCLQWRASSESCNCPVFKSSSRRQVLPSTTRSELMTKNVEQNPLLLELALDDSGQDIVEYALLTAIIGIAAIAIWNELTLRVGIVYTAADAGVQNLSACTPDPGQVSCVP